MADDLSLLFRLRGDAASLKQATAEGRAAVNQLKQSFGPELTQTVTVANKAFADISDNLTQFAGQRIPLVGNAFVNITGQLRGLSGESAKTEKALAGIGKSMQSIATQANRSTPEIARFLTRFTQLGTQAERDGAAVEFFGAKLATQLIPELEKTGTAMASVPAESAATGSAIAGLAAPVAIAAAGIVVMVGGLVLLTRELFNASKAAADFQGKMQDLSQQTGVAVETLSALEIAAATTGGNLNTITQALVQFQRKLDESLDPLSKTAAEFKDLGIESDNTEAALRSAFTALARMPEGFRQTNAAAELFGARGGKQVLAIIKETGGDIDGLIKHARDLGILIEGEAAKAADRFNDELALLNFQLRELQAAVGNELIPILTDLIRNFAELVRASRPFLEIVGRLARAPFTAISDSLRGLSIAARALTLDFKGALDAIRKVNEEAEKRRNIPAQPVEEPQPAGLPGQRTGRQETAEAERLADDRVAIVKRQVEREAQILNQAFEQGRRNREEQARETIELNRQVLRSETERIDAQLRVQEQAFKNIARERLSRQEVVDAELAIQAQVSKLQQERLDKEAEFERTSSAIRAKAAKERADSQRNEAANTVDRLVTEFENQIKAVQAGIDRGDIREDEGLTQIEQLERAKIDARIEGLEEQKRIGFLTIEEQKELTQQLQAAQQEADHLDEEQQRRRLARARLTAERIRDIKLAEIETSLQLEQLRAERIIASIEALADAQVLSEEEAARRILAIRLDLIDSEVEATRARLRAAGTIADTDERLRTEAELNNRLRILADQRVTTEVEGNRAVDDARRKDLNNQRRYNDELERLQERTRDIQLDAAEEVIRLMEVTFARRKDIIRAERDLDLAREADRHRRETDRLNQQKQAVDAEIKLLEERLERLTIGTTEEIEQYERIIAALERLRLKRLELERQQAAEDGRNKTRKRRVTKEADEEEKDADPFGRIKIGLEDIKSISRDIENTIVPLGEILKNTFLQVADAIGQTISNYVLLGTTGPAVMRKILAQALASIAAEAAVNAIKELALGFATLFFNPAESAGHFTAAALWGSIAGVSAVAGRAVAGNLFQPQQSGSGASGSGGRGTNERGEPNPIDLTRQQQTINVNIIVHGEPGPGFNQEVVRAVVHDVSINGPARDAIVKTAGG